MKDKLNTKEQERLFELESKFPGILTDKEKRELVKLQAKAK